MERILVGVDGSPAAEEALRWSADVVARAGLLLTAARVFVPTQAELDPQEYESLRDEQLHDLERACASLGAAGAAPRALLVDGDPTDALLRAAEDEAADLLVVGGRGSGGFADLHLGSVAHHLTHHATLPLAVVPRTGDDRVRRLVVGVDGSPGSDAAVGFCAELAGRLDVPVTALHVVERDVVGGAPTSWERSDAEIREWVGPIERAGVPTELEVERELHPVEAIARALEAAPGSVAVLGARGVGGVTRLRLGRVPLHLVHHTGRPVITVPPTADR